MKVIHKWAGLEVGIKDVDIQGHMYIPRNWMVQEFFSSCIVMFRGREHSRYDNIPLL